MDGSRERFWQERWRAAGLSEARRDPAREKFFALVAYPGTSGFLHIGHLRGLVIADVLHRFHRMIGKAVFFPTGTHATGLPAVTFAQRVKDRDPALVEQLEMHRVPPEEWAKLEDPLEVVRFLGAQYLRAFRRIGLLVDERAFVSTIDPDYQAFIGWQFRRLAERGALRQGSHYSAYCPVCGPVSVDPSETDLSKGGTAEVVQFTLLAFRLDDGRQLLAATLRPETVFGATNVWVPDHGELAVWHHGETEYLVGRSGGERLVEQYGGRIGPHPVPPGSLVGRSARAPITGAELPVFASALVDPEVGTGVVMSVPAHAPADWLALAQLPPEARARVGPPPVIVEFPPMEELAPSDRALLAGPGAPAERALRASGAHTLADTAALDDATQRLYRLEFLRGRMRADLLDGLRVSAARDRLRGELAEAGAVVDLREFSEPVLCRNGHPVVIRKVPDQWFLRYGDPSWKDEARAAFGTMRIFPPEYAAELPGILEWYEDRPCTRKGRWLGTPFPPDPSWIIEPIADSTFYPSYFIVRRFVADGRVPLASLTDAFFDHALLGTGPGEPSLDPRVQREVREEFLYWSPLDLNIGGKEHKRVHFPVFVYTHAKLLPPELRPRGIFAHWWLTDKGGAKVSKKKLGKGGDIPPLDESLERWGADGLRLFHLLAASPQQDIEWDPALADHASERVAEVERLVRELRTTEERGPPELDAWLLGRLHLLVREVRDALGRQALREAAERIYVGAPATVRRYLARGGVPGRAMETFVAAWVRLMQPITPHLAEELWAGRAEALVASAAFPSPDAYPAAPAAEAAESFLDAIEEDLRGVLKPALERGERPTAATFFLAAPWKRHVEAWMREVAARSPSGPPPIREIVDRAKAHPEIAAHVPQVAGYVARVYPALRSERTAAADVDEHAVLSGAEGYLARRHGFERILVVPEAAGEPHDPKNRRDRARPGRPAFYLSGPIASASA